MYMLPSTWDGPQVLHNWNQVNPKRDAPVSSASLKEGDPPPPSHTLFSFSGGAEGGTDSHGSSGYPTSTLQILPGAGK